jgi:hypothetical protein
MTTDAELKQSLFLFTHEQDRKVDAIAEALSQELGVRVSRSAAMRLLVDRFALPKRPAERMMTADKDAA